jgi:hypothetical protein
MIVIVERKRKGARRRGNDRYSGIVREGESGDFESYERRLFNCNDERKFLERRD